MRVVAESEPTIVVDGGGRSFSYLADGFGCREGALRIWV